MNIKIKTVAVSMLVALSFIFGACADQTIETPDAIDDAVNEGVEGIQEGAEDAGSAIKEGAEGIQEGAKDLEKSAEDAIDSVQDGVKQGTKDAGKAIKDLGDKMPSSEN